MNLSTKEIIKSKKHIFIILSLLIFSSGTIFGIGIGSVFRIRFSDPINTIVRAKRTFIGNTASLAETPEKEAKLRQFIRNYLYMENRKKFNLMQNEFQNVLVQLEVEIKKQIPKSAYPQLKENINTLKNSFHKFPPPPPPPEY